MAKYQYKAGRIRITSNVELNKEQIGSIVDTVNEVMLQGFYEPCYNVSREVYHEFKENYKKLSVETRVNWFGTFKITISAKSK